MALELRAGDLSLLLQPEIGGSVGAFRMVRPGGSIDLMRPARTAVALYSGMFPMVPFANCIRDNRFIFNGNAYRIKPNMEGTRLNFHGSGWLTPWNVGTQTRTHAELVLEDGRVDDVYAYYARQGFTLDDAGLTVTLSVSNRGPEPMPFSFGLHPWFPRHGTGLVQFISNGRWRGDDDGLALALDPQVGGGDYALGREPPQDWQNYCHTGWQRRAEIAWPEIGLGLRITADPVFAHLMVHVPASGEAVFCLEPQSNAPCAFDGLENGQIAEGVHVLGPDETVSGSVRFAPFAVQARRATK